MGKVRSAWQNKHNQQDPGQALIEFALALPMLLLLIFGVLELGRAFQTKIVMENAAREGAHYFIYDFGDANDGFVNTIQAVTAESQNSGVDIQSTDVTVQCLTSGTVNSPPTDCSPGSTIEVIVNHQFEVAIFSYILAPLDMSSNARMLVP